MTETAIAMPARVSRAHAQRMRALAGVFFWGIFIGNLVAIVWIWLANHNLDFSFAPDPTSTAITRVGGGLLGLLAAYLALVQLLLLARLPFLGRLAGFDRLTVWHRWNGYAVVVLVVAHTVMAIIGYSMDAHRSFFDEAWGMIGQDFFPGMVTATIALGLFVVVVVSSVTIVRRKLNYELWFAVHFTAYAAVALAWFHQVPIGGDLALSPNATLYWRILFFGSLGLLSFRLLSPLVNILRFGLRVAEVHEEGPGVTTLRIEGQNLERLHAQPGQFFLWRFLTRGHWYTAHPFSLSEAPDGRSLRISVKASGDHTGRMGSIPVGTRVVAEGPFGTFTNAVRHHDKALLIAGGIGITPVRALSEVMDGDVVVIHRVLSDEHIVFRTEMEELAARRGLTVHYVVGDHESEAGKDLLSPEHLRELVPDLAERDVYICGPPGMVSVALAHVRHAGVPHRRLHVERFAL